MSNIGKRFSNPSVWEKPLFTDLNTEQRLFWLFLNNRCDLAGVYQLHFQVDSAYLGVSIDQQFIQDFVRVINSDSKRVELISDMRLWLVGFVRYQQVGRNKSCLSKNSGPHISIVNKLKEHGIFNKAVKSDPDLFKEYTGGFVDEQHSSISHDSDSNKPNDRLKLGYDKPNDSLNNKPKTSLELAKHKAYSSSNSSSNGDSSNSDTSKTTNIDKAIIPESSLEHFKIVKELKKIIPTHVIDCSDKEMESDVENLMFAIKAGAIKNPKTFLIAKARTTDWDKHNWDDFYELLQDAVEEGAPF